jgi:hypothetical protein
MKKYLYFLLFLLFVGGGYLAGAHFSGGAWYTFGLPLGGEKGWLRETTTAFWEDIQFKDFKKAAQYHTPDKQDTVDIPYLLERMFLLKPELMDIMDYEIQFVDIDSTGLRARTKTRVHFKDLLNKDIRNQEILLYFHRNSMEEPWFMELESSLRDLGSDADKSKKH